MRISRRGGYTARRAPRSAERCSREPESRADRVGDDLASRSADREQLASQPSAGFRRLALEHIVFRDSAVRHRGRPVRIHRPAGPSRRAVGGRRAGVGLSGDDLARGQAPAGPVSPGGPVVRHPVGPALPCGPVFPWTGRAGLPCGPGLRSGRSGPGARRTRGPAGRCCPPRRWLRLGRRGPVGPVWPAGRGAGGPVSPVTRPGPGRPGGSGWASRTGRTGGAGRAGAFWPPWWWLAGASASRLIDAFARSLPRCPVAAVAMPVRTAPGPGRRGASQSPQTIIHQRPSKPPRLSILKVISAPSRVRIPCADPSTELFGQLDV